MQCSLNREDEWLECGSAHLENIELEVRLPYRSKYLYLIDERRNFLKKHDEYTKRLFFLWLNENKCGCYGSFAFFGEDDLSGCIFMVDFKQKLARYQLNESPNQPGFGQSIILSYTKLLDANMIKIADFPNKQKISLKKNYGRKFNANSEMIGPISSSGMLLKSYYGFLNVYSIDFSKKNTSTNMINRFEMIRSGINSLQLSCKESNKTQDNPLLAKNISSIARAGDPVVFHDQRPSDWNCDPETVYAWGNISSVMKIFLTPLSVEVMQRLVERAEMMLTAIHPDSIVHHAYASCASKCHQQPLTQKSSTITQSSLPPAISANIGLPPLSLTFFQGATIDNTITRGAKEESYTRSTTVDSTVALIHGDACHFRIFTRDQNDFI
ncbi:unnamed protein product [Thelazia callipaeda]|uniref:Uncharacterized protein n=1 Tax=Thelazia callipaeda TaxID=103827 RepID=A0A0N5DC55_THECL|nr:unnamed protein product [Thelazia callipaeda]